MGNENNISPSPNKAEEASPEHQKIQLWLQRNRALCDVFLDAYCIVDTANRVVEFNTAFTELCGESYRKVHKIGDFCSLIKTENCPDHCPAREVMSSQKFLRLDELTGSSKAFPSLQMILGGVPIFGDAGEVVGALITIRNVSAESELQKKYDERKKESVIDGLTRLFNKTYTESTLLRVIKTSLRELQGISVVMCDIDHFKRVNDTFGHQAGDYVLSTVAQMLKGETRDTDVCGRFGGEEFLVILCNSDVTGAKVFAERFRKRVASTQIMFEGKHVPVTVSLGSATFHERWFPGLNAENAMKELVAHADTALYFAKANGRNQTCQYESLPKQGTPPAKKDGGQKAA
jgi:diguanylate cyclase (GGDEF)-like protein